MNKFFTCSLLLILLLTSRCAVSQEVEGFDTTITVIPPPPQKQDEFLMVTEPMAVDVRRVPAEEVEALKKSEEYWYANLEPKKKEAPKADSPGKGRSFFEQTWFQNLLWIIILGSFIGVVVWYLASSNIRLFRKEAKKLSAETEVDGGGEDIFNIQYEKEIAKAEAAQDYRLAVRLRYLATLKLMSDRGLIVFRPERSDSDYVAALYGSPYYKQFFRLTRAFEYAWYGGFSLPEEIYTAIRSDFQSFQRSVIA